ncbi:YccT family protein [Photobacterium kasasachensis]|uniref:YccT family protein n=1 Tax=Photobacterium kasasachensis TaxID=2910240 RepID=UPI003D0D57EF
MKKLIGLSLVLLSGGLQAATVSSSKNVELLVVDGKKVQSSFWSPSESVELQPGRHQIVVRFDGELKNGSKKTMYTTRPYLFEMDVPDDDVTITLPRLTTLSQAKAHFNRGVQWQLESSDGSTSLLSYVELEGKGFGAFKNMEELVADYNRQHGITFEQGYAVNLEQAAVEVSEQGEVMISGDALAQLKLWYVKASAEEKAAFYQWAKAQDAQ